MNTHDPRLRTPSANKCLAALSYMKSDLLKYYAYFIPNKGDTTYYLNYLEQGDKLYKEGKFDKPASLENEEWDNEFNFRYGYNSIIGTHGEMLSIIIRNSTNGDAVGWNDSHKKTDEVKGRDCVVYNPKWSKPYVSQVKLLSTKNGDIIFFRQYLKYDPKDVDRLTLVDIHSKIMYEMNYPLIKSLTENEHPSIKKTIEGYSISKQHLRDIPSLRFYRYELRE